MLFRRITCTLLLVVFLFNLFGYKLVLHYWEQHENVHFFKKPNDGRYNSDDVTQIKIPLRIAYIKDNKAFEYIDGEIEYRGQFYQYVSGEISGDTLIILCKPNVAKTKFHSAKDAFLGMMADQEKSTPSKKNSESSSRPLFKAMGDCILDSPRYALRPILHTYFSYGLHFVPALGKMSISVPWHPPDSNA